MNVDIIIVNLMQLHRNVAYILSRANIARLMGH